MTAHKWKVAAGSSAQACHGDQNPCQPFLLSLTVGLMAPGLLYFIKVLLFPKQGLKFVFNFLI